MPLPCFECFAIGYGDRILFFGLFTAWRKNGICTQRRLGTGYAFVDLQSDKAFVIRCSDITRVTSIEFRHKFIVSAIVFQKKAFEMYV